MSLPLNVGAVVILAACDVDAGGKSVGRDETEMIVDWFELIFLVRSKRHGESQD